MNWCTTGTLSNNIFLPTSRWSTAKSCTSTSWTSWSAHPRAYPKSMRLWSAWTNYAIPNSMKATQSISSKHLSSPFTSSSPSMNLPSSAGLVQTYSDIWSASIYPKKKARILRWRWRDSLTSAFLAGSTASRCKSEREPSNLSSTPFC